LLRYFAGGLESSPPALLVGRRQLLLPPHCLA
jgi:hypothetical protein